MQTMKPKTFEPTVHILVKPNHKTFNTAELVLVGNACVYYIERCGEGHVEAGRDFEGFYWASYTKNMELQTLMYIQELPTLDSALAALDYEMACLYGLDSPWCADATGF